MVFCIRRRDYETKNYHCEVFDSDTRAWQKKDDISLPWNVFSKGSAIFWGGAIHWLASNDTILAFDVGLEIYTIISLPMHMCKNNHYRQKILTKYKVRLPFICEIQTPGCNYGTFEIRVIEDYMLERRFVMGMEGIKKERLYRFYYPIAFSSDDMALMMDGDGVMFYRFPHNVVKKYDFSASEVFAFRSDFEAVVLRASGLISEGRDFGFRLFKSFCMVNMLFLEYYFGLSLVIALDFLTVYHQSFR